MSLESYRKTIAAEQTRENYEYQENIETSTTREPEQDEYYSYFMPEEKKRRGIGKYIFLLIVLALVFLAALKNPSRAEAKEEVNSLILEKLDAYVDRQVAETDNSLVEFGSSLAKLLAPTLVDNIVQTEVTNYFLFSTFESHLSVKMVEDKKIVSGVIVFGQVIPLDSDLKDGM